MDRTNPSAAEHLTALIRQRTARIGIIGLGYVGLPLAKAMLDGGYRVIGFDVDPKKIDMLNSGRTYIRHLPTDMFEGARVGDRFLATADLGMLGEADVILICVPTPLTKHREPDLTFIERTALAIKSHLRQGQLIILESTTYPGTTRDIIKPILENSGLVSGRDFFLAFSPEREDPGNLNFSTKAIPKVVGGESPDALSLAAALYESVVPHTVLVSTLETAEAVKLTENIFRAVNIALVNELKIVFAEMGIDIWEVIEAAKTKPFGYMPFYPGPGLGGHCIPIDPFYLTWKAREYGLSTKFIELAGEINTNMPRYVVSRLAHELDHREGKGLKGARILVIGLAYKRNIDDTRESPSFKLIELLEARGARCEFHDPYVPCVPSIREHPELKERKSVALDPETLSVFDAVLIATDHDVIDYVALAKSAKLIIDTRNACARAGADLANVIKA